MPKPRSKKTKLHEKVAKLEQLIYPGIDWKTKDTKAIAANIPNTPYQNYPMLAIGQGSGNNQRTGDKVSLRHGTLYLSLTRGDTSNIIRVLLVKTPSSTFAGLSDVLEYHDVSTDGDLVFSSPYQTIATNSEQTYQVLFDKVYQLKNDMSTVVDKIKLKLPKKGISCDFVGTSVVQPNNYNVSLLIISDSTAAPHPKASYVMRWKYIDL